MYAGDTSEFDQAALLALDSTPAGWTGHVRAEMGDSSARYELVAAGNYDDDPQDELIFEGIAMLEGPYTTGIDYGASSPYWLFAWQSWPYVAQRMVNYHPADVDHDGLLDLVYVTVGGLYWQRQAP